MKAPPSVMSALPNALNASPFIMPVWTRIAVCSPSFLIASARLTPQAAIDNPGITDARWSAPISLAMFNVPQAEFSAPSSTLMPFSRPSSSFCRVVGSSSSKSRDSSAAKPTAPVSNPFLMPSSSALVAFAISLSSKNSQTLAPSSGISLRKKLMIPSVVEKSGFFSSTSWLTRSSCIARSVLRQACRLSTSRGGHQSSGTPVLDSIACTSRSVPPVSRINWPCSTRRSLASYSLLPSSGEIAVVIASK